MNTFTNAPIPLKLIGAFLVLALIAAAALLSVTFTAGPTQAQSELPATPTPPSTPVNTYNDPQPCGPGAQTAFMEEPHEITTGHFALFDAYWQNTTVPADDPLESGDLDNTGILHTNTCPPLVVKTTQPDPDSDEEGAEITVTTLSASGIDIDEAIFHVLDKHEATVVTGLLDNPDGTEISITEYPELADHTDVGDQVWWLRLDDPDLSGDQTSDLALGFSTKRFDGQYWGDAEDGGLPLRYKFEIVRNPGISPDQAPHFLAYRAEQLYVPGAVPVWDSAEADVFDMMMEPGRLSNLQWIFTKPGTYQIAVHLQGWVRQENPYEENDPQHGNWKPISGNVTETSEIKVYTIQVGEALDEVEPPHLGLSFTVDEDAAPGTHVGTPVQVFAEEVPASELTYSLTGTGEEDFDLQLNEQASTLQVVVANAATLNHEDRATYDLTLGVTDNRDHESNFNPALDHTIPVRITLSP